MHLSHEMRSLESKQLRRPISKLIMAPFNAVNFSFSSIQGLLVETLSHFIINMKQRSVLIKHIVGMYRNIQQNNVIFHANQKDIRVHDTEISDDALSDMIIL